MTSVGVCMTAWYRKCSGLGSPHTGASAGSRSSAQTFLLSVQAVAVHHVPECRRAGEGANEEWPGVAEALPAGSAILQMPAIPRFSHGVNLP